MSDQKIYTDKRGRRWVRDVDGAYGWWGGLDDVGYGFEPWSCEEADGRVTAEDGEWSQDGQRMFYRFSPAPEVTLQPIEDLEVEVDVHEAAARIVRATAGRDLTEAEAERLRAMTVAGMFRAAWER